MDKAADTPSLLQIDLAQQIVAMIQAGGAKPGDHLTEDALSKQFGVSRSPVRAALRLLEERGYLEKRPNAGVFVSKRAPKLRAMLVAPNTVTEEDLYRSVISDRANQLLGDTLSESELTARYGATKPALMRVLLRMNSEGLIERRKGRGWQFLPMLDSEDAKNESYRIRLVLECASLREPTFRIDFDELKRVREAHERFLKLKPSEQNPTAFFEISANFHELFGAFSGNRFFQEAISKQNNLRRFEEFASYTRGLERLADACEEHLEIIKALESGDKVWAEALLHRHLSIASTF